MLWIFEKTKARENKKQKKRLTAPAINRRLETLNLTRLVISKKNELNELKELWIYFDGIKPLQVKGFDDFAQAFGGKTSVVLTIAQSLQPNSPDFIIAVGYFG